MSVEKPDFSEGLEKVEDNVKEEFELYKWLSDLERGLDDQTIGEMNRTVRDYLETMTSTVKEYEEEADIGRREEIEELNRRINALRRIVDNSSSITEDSTLTDVLRKYFQEPRD